MRKRAFVSVLLAALVLCSPALAQRGPAKFLTNTPSDAAPLDIAQGYLQNGLEKAGLDPADQGELVVRDQYVTRHNGTTHIYFRQMMHGLEVINSDTSINISRDGRIINLNDQRVLGLKYMVPKALAQPTVRPADAILYAAEHFGLDARRDLVALERAQGPERAARFNGAGISLDPIPVRLVYFATDSSVRMAYDLVIRQNDHWWNVWVAADNGEILGASDWVDSETYQVFALPKESPNDGPRTIESGVADATASPFGWHDTDGIAGAEYTITWGNNVRAQEDRDANNSGGFSPDGGGSLDFQFALDLATQSPVDYQSAAVANLFYWNNIMHDLLYQYGFDEASGNFQLNNYGRGGSSGDPVLADAQDGSGTNNANFGTPQDGFAPRMQMYEWLPSNLNEVVVDAGSSAAGSYEASNAAFGPSLNTTGVSGSYKLADDGAGTVTDGCEAFSAGFFSGNIALIDRGSCSFVTKVRNAQNAGALAVVVINNASGSAITLGDDGTGGDIVIASGMVNLTDGNTIKAGLPATGTFRANPNPPLNRDSDLDAGIIAHEYCHGLSNRLTGGRTNSNCLTGDQQAGEGWSDLCALFFTAVASDTETTARGVGTYSVFEPATGAGIRTFPYTTDMGVNPLTYGDLTTGTLSIPHGIGTVWATAVWEMYWNLTNAYGFDSDLYNGTGGNNLAIQLVVDGLKLQGCNPSFLDARDGILLADQNNNGGANQCMIWEAFAKRGMGVNAADGGGASSLSVTENFDIPLECISGCGNLVCEEGEDCLSCPTDCPSGTTSGGVCGNGICEAGNGEDCVSCAADCNGQQGGKPANRFCCGDGDGDGPVACSDSRCSTGGFSCTDIPVGGGSFCCGDTTCDEGESCATCALDCTIGVEFCNTGVDEDCDGAIDCADSDCASDPSCQGGGSCGNGVCELGEDCLTCASDCAGVTGGKPANRYCCGNGTLEGPEGNGSICDNNP